MSKKNYTPPVFAEPKDGQAPPNPWECICWKKTVADGDESVIYPAYCAEHGIDISLLPEPYTGRPDSKVVCLNLNPGLSDCDLCFRFNKTLCRETHSTLCHDREGFMWLDTDIRCADDCGGLHGGCRWWRQRTQELREAVRDARQASAGGEPLPTPDSLDIFDLEYFPYHTCHAFSFPSLPSDSYRNHLLRQALRRAMRREAIIVIMRGKKQWTDLINELVEGGVKALRGESLIELRSSQNPALTKNNVGDEEQWERLVQMLRDPLPPLPKSRAATTTAHNPKPNK